ncbi:hypothetical protein A9Q98_03905 [Thalassotalea sp. 42_200_T64]|nr:hypothetical protein A9Q98_03905 [Thalassotalea sp. 42_200_T64]
MVDSSRYFILKKADREIISPIYFTIESECSKKTVKAWKNRQSLCFAGDINDICFIIPLLNLGILNRNRAVAS